LSKDELIDRLVTEQLLSNKPIPDADGGRRAPKRPTFQRGTRDRK
jgi:hypothetical protein